MARLALALLTIGSPGTGSLDPACHASRWSGTELIGRVTAPAGTPLDGVRVELVYTVDDVISPEDERLAVGVDADGVFEFEDVHDGAVKLIAYGPGLVSEPLDLGLSRAARVDGLEVGLLPEGRVRGRLLDLEGRPEVGRLVSVIWRNNLRIELATDAAGEFDSGRIPPGPAVVIAWPTEDEIQARAKADELEDARKALRRQQRLEVASGRTSEVRLQPLPKSLVRLHGRLFYGGSPGAQWVAVIDEDQTLWLPRKAKEDGSYALLLPGPGRYQIEVVVPFGEVGIPWSEQVQVPALAAFDHDVFVPLGAIICVVQDADGQPCAGAEVTWRMHDNLKTPGQWRLGRTDAAGRLRIEQAPTYDFALSAAAGTCVSPWTAVQVRAGAISLVELRLERR